jgi:hypothetical protein
MLYLAVMKKQVGRSSLVTFTILTVGCGAAPAPSAPVTHVASRPTPPPPATPSSSAPTLVRAASSAAVRYSPGYMFAAIGDGKRGGISGRRRVTFTDRASVVDATPIDDLEAMHVIPAAFGGGFVFTGKHAVRYAPTFDGALIEITRTKPAAKELRAGVGFSQILVASDVDPAKLFDLPTGAVAKPPVARLAELLAVPTGGYVLARTDAGEVFVVSGKGRPFKKAPLSHVTSLGFDGAVGFALSDAAVTAVGPNGENLAQEASGRLREGLDVFDVPNPSPSNDERLLYARRMSDRASVATVGLDLEVWDVASGAQSLKTRPFGFRNCSLVRGGTPSLFACNAASATGSSPAEPFTIYRLDAPDAEPVEDRRFEQVIDAGSSSNIDGAPFVVGAHCDGSGGGFCVRRSDGKWNDVALPADPKKLLDRVPAYESRTVSAEGAPYAFAWARPNMNLVIVDGDASRVRAVPIAEDLRMLIRFECSRVEGGVVRFALKERGVLEIGADDVARVKKIEGIYSFCNARGLVATPDGKLRETEDGGVTVHDVALPPDGLAPSTLTCGSTGCRVGSWVRIGWSGAR